jgi:uncharacterized membrane protein YgcG
VSQCHEVIDWSSNPDTLRATAAFRDEVIHPHIFQQVTFTRAARLSCPSSLSHTLLTRPLCAVPLCLQDGKSLDFLYYFDYLRAYPRDYSSMTSAFAAPSGGGGSGSGKPPMVRVTGGSNTGGGANDDADFEE